MRDKVLGMSSDLKEKVTDIRRKIHQNPELSFKEYETSKFVQNELERIGVSFQTGIAGTGVVGLIQGKNPESKVVALRADMDALPIQEENDISYKSKNTGVMHACGHDVHTACLLGSAEVLNSLREEFNGTVKLIFQPGEERLPGGASLMIKDGVLKNPSPTGIIGQHVYPELPVGKIGIRSGMYMASCDELHVEIIGKGGHAALPHLCIDPVLIASQIVVALQQVVSRNGNPATPSVLSFGKVEANGATNILPDKVKLAGTFRTFDEDWRMRAHQLMKEMATGIAISMGGQCNFDIGVGYPFLSNDQRISETFRNSALELLGSENVVDLDLRMTAEDFAYFAQEIPGCFYRLGVAASENEKAPGLHTSTFNVDESALEVGMALMAFSCVKELSH